ncbi:MAG: RHS repeat protein, partial [Planctomycetaceae bacterium]|nr:RHS repeat protein [Planctomycetaceae bacterium]
MQPRLFTIVFVLVCFVLIRNELVQSIFAETFTEVLVKTQVTNLSAILRQNLRQLKSPPTKTDKGAGSVPNATIRLVEIQTQNIYRYDNSGLLAESIDRFGNSMRYEYDKLDRRTKTITPTL